MDKDIEVIENYGMDIKIPTLKEMKANYERAKLSNDITPVWKFNPSIKKEIKKYE